MSLVKDFVEEARRELEDDRKDAVKEIIKERLIEIEAAETVLKKLKKKYKELLDKDISEVLLDD